MTRTQTIAMGAALLVVGLLIGTFLLGRAVISPKEVIKEVPKEVTREVVKEVPKEVTKEVPKQVTKVVVKEVPMTLSNLAEAIRRGEIDVGDEYGMGLDQRYHKIHTAVLGMACESCHTTELTHGDVVFFDRDTSPTNPGPVDRRSCQGCHGAGSASAIYAAGAR